MTMTYIPVQTSNNNNNNKLLYVPVNSIQASIPPKQQHQQPQNLQNHQQHQQQQHQQQTREGNDTVKTVLLSHPQTLQSSNNIVSMTPQSRSDGAFTTVRIQGGTQNTLVPKSPFLHVAMKQEEGVVEMIHNGGGMNMTQGVNSTTPREIQQFSHMAANGRRDKRKQAHLDRMDISPFGGEVSSSPVHKKRRGRPPSCECICLFVIQYIGFILQVITRNVCVFLHEVIVDVIKYFVHSLFLLLHVITTAGRYYQEK